MGSNRSNHFAVYLDDELAAIVRNGARRQSVSVSTYLQSMISQVVAGEARTLDTILRTTSYLAIGVDALLDEVHVLRLRPDRNTPYRDPDKPLRHIVHSVHQSRLLEVARAD